MNIATVLQMVFTLPNLLWMNIGIFAGIIVGALPGLTAPWRLRCCCP